MLLPRFILGSCDSLARLALHASEWCKAIAQSSKSAGIVSGMKWYYSKLTLSKKKASRPEKVRDYHGRGHLANVMTLHRNPVAKKMVDG